MEITTDPATGTVSVKVADTNTRIFYEGREHDNYYTGINREVIDWLDEHDPKWDLSELFGFRGEHNFIFSSMAHALMFKLRWGGR